MAIIQEPRVICDRCKERLGTPDDNINEGSLVVYGYEADGCHLEDSVGDEVVEIDLHTHLCQRCFDRVKELIKAINDVNHEIVSIVRCAPACRGREDKTNDHE